MSAIFHSIDETLARIKDETASTIQSHKDTIFALQTELALHKSLTAAATVDRDKYMRIATQLITQFGTVEKVFSTAKEMALALDREADSRTDRSNKDSSVESGASSTPFFPPTNPPSISEPTSEPIPTFLAPSPNPVG